MKPSPVQYLFANNWPLKAYFGVTGLLGIWLAVSVCQPSRSMFDDWSYLLLFIFSMVTAPILTCVTSLIFGWIILGPLYHWGGRLNGAPFRVGDQVRILVGPHRDRVVEVCDVWDSRSEVVVDLKETSTRDVPDVFSFTQVCRESADKLEE